MIIDYVVCYGYHEYKTWGLFTSLCQLFIYKGKKRKKIIQKKKK